MIDLIVGLLVVGTLMLLGWLGKRICTMVIEDYDGKEVPEVEPEEKVDMPIL